MSTLRDAGESVRRRGFLDGDQAEAFSDDLLMAQLGRMMEEVGEFARSCRSASGPSVSELADIAIVCGAIANHSHHALATLSVKVCHSSSEQGSGGARLEQLWKATPTLDHNLTSVD